MEKKDRWSPYPQDACVLVLENNIEIGFGTHPIFDVVPGAWNIFWLTFAQLDQMAYYKGDLSKYLVTCDALAVCAGAAMQMAPKPNSAYTIGELANRMRPKEFLSIVSTFPTFLPTVFYGEKWMSVAKARARKYRNMPDNVVNIDFRRGG